jgi:hypothetical protein
MPTKSLYKARLLTGEWFTSDDVPLVGTNDEWRRLPGGDTLQLQVCGALPFLPRGTKALTDVFPDVRDPTDGEPFELPDEAVQAGFKLASPMAERSVTTVVTDQGNTLYTSEPLAEIKAAMTAARAIGTMWLELVPSGTLVNVAHIVSISDYSEVAK